MSLRYLSVCSGIEAASVAWAPLMWSPVGFAEIEAFPSAVLAHRHGSNLPGQPWSGNAPPNFGDMTRFKEWPDATIDLLVGGTPCQSFSVAGLRKGMADPRGNLALTYLAIADRYRPEWLVWENVPGVLSSNGGRDFGAIVGGMVELGYSPSWRVLDAQYVRVDGFGRAVPQRRRRVFVVGNSGDWRRSAAVLFEPESLSGNPPPRREAGKGLTRDIAPSLTSGGRSDYPADSRGQDAIIAIPSTGDVAHCLNAGGMGRQDYETETVIAHALRADGFDASEDGTGRGTPLVPVVAKTLTRGAESSGKGGYAGRRQEDDDNLIAFNNTGQGWWDEATVAATLRKGDDQGGGGARESSIVAQQWAIRRLTPRECERLQGFPDDYTLIPYRGKLAADGPRYKAIGNSMAVNVMRWLGRRIELVNALVQEAA